MRNSIEKKQEKKWNKSTSFLSCDKANERSVAEELYHTSYPLVKRKNAQILNKFFYPKTLDFILIIWYYNYRAKERKVLKMSIIGLFVGFCYAMLFMGSMSEQFLVCGLCGLIGLILDMIIVRISMYIQRKKVMKKIRKNRK